MRLLTLIIVLVFFIIPAQAYYPSAIIKFHNAKLVKKNIEKLGDEWLVFLEQEPAILKAKDKDYKVDQYCRFSAKLDAEGHVDINSVKLVKHKENFAYNLRAIEFLRSTPFLLEQKDKSKLIEIEMKYLAF